MAGVDGPAPGAHGRNALDADVNMIPMIDLLIVTIAFLLITSVWTHMGRLEAEARAPTLDDAPNTDREAPPRSLDVRVEEDRFVLTWREGPAIVDPPGRVEVARTEGAPRYDALATAAGDGWRTLARARPREATLAIVRTDNATEYGTIAKVLDALAATHGAFRVTLASN